MEKFYRIVGTVWTVALVGYFGYLFLFFNSAFGDKGMRRSSALTTALLSLALLTTAHAANFAAGMEAYEQGDFVAALKEWRPLAEQGDAAAQVRLGRMYAEGQGLPPDDVEAAKWYRKAAEAGDAWGQAWLGTAYYKGRGLPQNHVLAAEWYRKAAEQGYAVGQYGLGYLYSLGLGVQRNWAEAAKFFRKAAEQGVTWAQVKLGLAYDFGKGVPQNDVRAYAWYSVAIAQGRLGEDERHAVVLRDLVAERMSAQTRADAQRLAQQYWEAYVLPFRD